MIKLRDIITEVEADLGKDTTKQFQSKLDDVLDNWLIDSDEESAKWLYKNFNVFKKLKTKYPKIFAPKFPNGTKLYRGLTKPNQELIDQVTKDKANKEKFEKTTISGKTWYKYKKKINYNPHTICQSWTQEPEIASGYIDDTDGMRFILQTQQDDSFLFNSDFLGGKYDFNKELIHFGKDFPKGVYLLVKWK
jgi:hypothetical protein